MEIKAAVKCLVLVLILLGAAMALVPPVAEAHIVCDDNLRFCLAGCTSSSPSSCRPSCYAEYNACESSFNQPPSKPPE